MNIKIGKISNLTTPIARRACVFLALTALACSTASAVVNFSSTIDANTTYTEIGLNLFVDAAIADLELSEPVDFSQVIAAENLWITIPGAIGEATLQAEFQFFLEGSGAASNDSGLQPLTALGGDLYGFDSSVNSFVADQFALMTKDSVAIRVFKESEPIAGSVGTILGSTADSGARSGIQFGGDLTVVPEPSTYAALAGVLVLGFVALKRRNHK